jgi:uncharacterized small protein (DUF1192 family)
VNALRGEASAYERALSEADAYCQELDTVRELQCRIDELTAERDALRAELDRCAK